jgi:hypothetical protein
MMGESDYRPENGNLARVILISTQQASIRSSFHRKPHCLRSRCVGYAVDPLAIDIMWHTSMENWGTIESGVPMRVENGSLTTLPVFRNK